MVEMRWFHGDVDAGVEAYGEAEGCSCRRDGMMRVSK